MERCDFSSVITIISDHISESKRGNQSDLMYALFDTFATDEINAEETFDEGAVCRWVNGVRKISPRITKYYADNDKKICLSSDIEQNILPMMYDSDMAVREIYNLVVYDTTISDGVKQKLTAGYPFSNSEKKADFLCAVLCFSMERSFIKRETGSKKLTTGKALSPIVNDVIFGADVPQPCRYFCGRDKELDALHDQLSENSKIFLQGIPGIGKSELTKAYAKKHKKDYTNIIYLNYSGSLKADIVNLDFADDYNASEPEAERFRRHARFLRSLKDDSLIIIDNFNTVASDDETLSTVLAYSCRILFTTRSRFDEYNDSYTVEDVTAYDGIAKDDWVVHTYAANTADDTDVFVKANLVNGKITSRDLPDIYVDGTKYALAATYTEESKPGTTLADAVEYNGYIFDADASGATDVSDYVIVLAGELRERRCWQYY